MKSKTSRLMFVAIAFALLATTALAEKVNVLYSFKGTSGGDTPLANFISDTAGNLYGVTGFGGINCDNTGNGCGTVFELSHRQKREASGRRRRFTSSTAVPTVLILPGAVC